MTEDPACYASPGQRRLLARLFASGLLDGFFLTGGTCLAVFYLHHRRSADLDVFTANDRDLTELATPLRAILRPQSVLAATATYWSAVVDEVRIDLVVDPLSSKGARPVVTIDGVDVPIDRLDNIGPNKIAALVSPGAARDAVDCYLLYGSEPDRFLRDYGEARNREALLDDHLYARERLLLIAEEAAAIVDELAPDLRVEVDSSDLASTFERFAARLELRTP